MSDQEVDAVVRAWRNAGRYPHFHMEMQKRLKREWPTLHTAVTKLVAHRRGQMSTGKQFGKTALLAEIQRLIDDLDNARSDGTIYTYGQVQERLREMMEAHRDD